ncbi:MAG: N-terminal domain of oligopeptide transport permease, partial [Chloroflexota bacterium]|nr:N-terminal domain of oligopeptide transport permease [Chloroflexota bacterium]
MAEIIGPIDLPPTTPAEQPDYDVQLESLNQWQIAWRRFKRHRMALIGSTMFLGMVAIGIIAPLFFQFDSYKVPTPDVHVVAGRPP